MSPWIYLYICIRHVAFLVLVFQWQISPFFYLSWNTHMSYICQRLWSVSCCLYRLRNVSLFPIRTLIVDWLAYSICQYGIAAFAQCFELRRCKIDAILKSVLESVAYGSDFPSKVSIFTFIQLLSFKTLFQETTVLRYYCEWRFQTAQKTISFVKIGFSFWNPSLQILLYSECIRYCYVPQVLNSLPDFCSNLESKRALKSALGAKRC